MPNLSLINQMLSELVICLKGVFCPGHVRKEKRANKIPNFNSFQSKYAKVIQTLDFSNIAKATTYLRVDYFHK